MNFTIINNIFTFAIIIILLSSCDFNSTNNTKKKNLSNKESKQTNSFPFISIPSFITTNEGKVSYFAIHYWDNIDFKDSIIHRKDSLFESGFKIYISFLSKCNKEICIQSIDSLNSKASRNNKNYTFFRNLSEETLYNPNSILRNDEIYEIFLQCYTSSDSINDYIKERYIKQLSIVKMNKIGEFANDISYKDEKGSIGKLSKIKADYTIIYFYNPECDGCKKTTSGLIKSKIINYLLDKKIIHLLSIFPDNDITKWKEYNSVLPLSWLKGYDYKHIIEDKPLYDLKAIPTLYLLDKNKKVIIKDASIQEIEEWLYKMQNKE